MGSNYDNEKYQTLLDVDTESLIRWKNRITGLGLNMTTEIFEKVLFEYHFMKEPQLEGILYDVIKTDGCIVVEVYIRWVIN